MAEAPIPIRRVRRDGQVDLLGEWSPSTKELALDQPGFPLTPPGVHKIKGDVPWVFDEMAPSGYFAENFGRWCSALQLPAMRHLWSAMQVQEVVSTAGADLSGNLIIGSESSELYIELRSLIAASGGKSAHGHSCRMPYSRFTDHLLKRKPGSFVGGDEPKLVLELPDGSGLIVKLSPPLSTLAGQRWANLLRMEALAADTLRAAGIDAVESRYLEKGDRSYLEIKRFDRLTGGGRIGHVTLLNLGMALYGEASNPASVIAGLVRDGHIPPEDGDRFSRQHAFSKAIANTDAHLGNYGLLINDDGNARLSPAYDVLPMAFAPRQDGVPDRLVKHTGTRDAATNELVQRLIAAVEVDKVISRNFREAWLRAVG